MTSRVLVEKDFEQIAESLHRAVTITLNIPKEYGKLLKDFNKGLVNNKEYGKLLKDFNKGLVNNKDTEELKSDVEKFASSFDMPGFSTAYKDQV